MRRAVAVLALSIVAALGMYVPTAAAATSTTKIVIVVGAVEGQTSSYRDSANKIYAEAIKYSSNVKKVYSPNATWSKVKAAIAGANIVVYLGHGNGYPSKYATSPRPATQNGFGLNEPTNPSDNRHKYYGEQYVDDVDLAPNAIVLLHRLCYASGAAEPGDPEPSLSTARARVDNYAAGFIRAGARAVIADGHQSVAGYIKALFTTNQTVDQMWRTTMDYGHIRTFTSSRSSGFTGYTDPKTSTTGYYRSMVAKPSVTTRQIIGFTGDGFSVPGRASVSVDGAPVLSPTTLAATGATLPIGTRLTVVARSAQLTADGNTLLEVAGLDDPSITGLVEANHLQPRDSVSPTVVSSATSPSTFSPNGDGRTDATTVRVTFSESVSWRARFKDGDTVLAEQTGTGSEAVATWNGLVSGEPVASGTYSFTVEGVDAWLNAPATKSGSLQVDLIAPSIDELDPAVWLSPNGDGFRDTTKVSGMVSEAGTIIVRVRADDTTIRTLSADAKAGYFALAWNGRDDAGNVAPDGIYDLVVTPRDAASNDGEAETTRVMLNTALGSVRTGSTQSDPQDGDRASTRTTLSFVLDREATVTWTLRDADGAVVATFVDGETLDAGTHRRLFDGRVDGAALPAGVYRSFVSVTIGDLSASQAATVEIDGAR